MIFAFTLMHCIKNPIESDVDNYEGEFHLISINPNLNCKLTNCDTITVLFSYTLPERIETTDSIFTFYMVLRIDTIADGKTFNPTNAIKTWDVQSRNWNDTLEIWYPLNEFDCIDIQNKPLEISFYMKTKEDCKERTEEHYLCYCVIEYTKKYYFTY